MDRFQARDMGARKVTKWNMVAVMAWFLSSCFHSFHDHHEGWDATARGYFDTGWKDGPIFLTFASFFFYFLYLAKGTIHLNAYK